MEVEASHDMLARFRAVVNSPHVRLIRLHVTSGVVAALALSVTAPALAQARTPGALPWCLASASPRDSARRDTIRGTAPDDPAIVLIASVRMRELRFAREPNIDVAFSGCRDVDSVRVLERRNLPTPVVAGTTYRDVFVSVALFGHVGAACLLRDLGLGPDTVIIAGTASKAPLVCPTAARDDSSAIRPPDQRRWER